MGLTKTPVVLPTMLSALGKACVRMDLTAVHDILLKVGYKDEEGAESEVRLCFFVSDCGIYVFHGSKYLLYSICSFHSKSGLSKCKTC